MLKTKQKKLTVMKQFSFDSAHQLHGYDGPCANLHGHTYKLEVYVNGAVDSFGFVIDFAILKKIVKENIIDLLDHQFLNEIITHPTAENIATFIFDKLEPIIAMACVKNNKAVLCKVVVWETPSSCVVVKT